jgi:Fe-S-cluster containining protein
MKVTVLEKPMHEWCPHVCSRGCGIYETRPDECRGFVCSWLAGALPEHLKPNKVKAMMYAYVLPNGVARITLHEDNTMPGAFERYPEFQMAAQVFVEHGFEFLVLSGKTRKLFTPFG